MVIASTIASTAMGSDIVSSRIIREIAMERGGTAEGTVWFDGRNLFAPEAARVNAVMSLRTSSPPRWRTRATAGSTPRRQRSPTR